MNYAFLLNGSWDRSRTWDDIRLGNRPLLISAQPNDETFHYWSPSLSSVITLVNPATLHPKRTSAVLSLHRREHLITKSLCLSCLFLLQAISHPEWEALFVAGACKPSTPGATGKHHSEVIPIWQWILPLETLTVKVEEIFIKWIRTNLQFGIMKHSYSMC